MNNVTSMIILDDDDILSSMMTILAEADADMTMTWCFYLRCCWWCLFTPFLSTTGSRWCADMIVRVPVQLLLMLASTADRGLPPPGLVFPSMMDCLRLKPLKALWDSLNCSRVVKWTLDDVDDDSSLPDLTSSLMLCLLYYCVRTSWPA